MFAAKTHPEYQASQPCYDDHWLFRRCLYIDAAEFRRARYQNQDCSDSRSQLLAQAQGRDIVVDAVTDPHRPQDLIEFLQRHDVVDCVTVLTQDREWCQHNPGFRYYPQWVLKAINDHLNYPKPWPDTHWQHRQHRVSCQNRLPRPHRFLTYYLLAQQPWFSEVFFSFGGWNPTGDNDLTYYWQRYFTESQWQFFRENEPSWPIKHDTAYEWRDVLGQHNHLSPAYRDCYANIATETECYTPFISEKTTKCLRTGVLLWAAAALGHFDHIRSLGFEINLPQQYDQIPHEQTRITAMVNDLVQHYQDIPDMWHENQQQIQANSQLFGSTEFAVKLLKDVEDLICW